MAGMFLAGNPTFVGIGLGTIIVVATAMIGSLTVLPAVLSRLGDKVETARIPGLARSRSGGEPRVWGALLDRVLRRPLFAALLAGGVLVALAMPALRLHAADPGSGDLPQGIAAVQTLNRIDAVFPGAPEAAAVVVKAADVTSPRFKQRFGASNERSASQAPGMSRSRLTSTPRRRSRSFPSHSPGRALAFRRPNMR